ELAAQPGDHPRRRFALDCESGRAATQLVRHRERRLALAGRARQLRLDRGATHEQLVELRLRRVAERTLCGKQSRKRLARPFGTRFALDRSGACRFGGFARGPLELARLDARLARVRLYVGELRPNLLDELDRRLTPQDEPLRSATQAVQHLHRLLAPPGGVGELLLGAATLIQDGFGLPVGGAASQARCRLALVGLRGPIVERDGGGLGESRVQLRELAAQLLGALRGRRLEREGTQPLLDLFFVIARAIDLHRDPSELQLRAMPARLEAAEPRRLLDERASLLRPGREDR